VLHSPACMLMQHAAVVIGLCSTALQRSVARASLRFSQLASCCVALLKAHAALQWGVRSAEAVALSVCACVCSTSPTRSDSCVCSELMRSSKHKTHISSLFGPAFQSCCSVVRMQHAVCTARCGVQEQAHMRARFSLHTLVVFS
jgi:hypothetical protein